MHSSLLSSPAIFIYHIFVYLLWWFYLIWWLCYWNNSFSFCTDLKWIFYIRILLCKAFLKLLINFIAKRSINSGTINRNLRNILWHLCYRITLLKCSFCSWWIIQHQLTLFKIIFIKSRWWFIRHNSIVLIIYILQSYFHFLLFLLFVIITLLNCTVQFLMISENFIWLMLIHFRWFYS